jgi:hypothetical protein
VPEQPFTDDPTGRGVAMANKVADLEIVKSGLADIVESYNEFFGYDNIGDWPKADIFQASFYDQIKSRGVRAEPIALNCGTGNLLSSDMVNFPQTLSRYKFYGFHAYSWPSLRTSISSYALRYKSVMSEVKKVVPGAKAIITELGITNRVTGGPDLGYKVIKSDSAYWNDDLLWYNEWMLADNDVIGACIFQCGGYPDWSTFEVLDNKYVLDRMADLNVEGTANVSEEQINAILQQLDALWGYSVKLDESANWIRAHIIEIKKILGR